MPKFDIIVPAYNAERFLRPALDSVIAQTVSDWRIILVDDGSTDTTAAIAQEYVHRLGPRMLYVKQTNKGLPAARNTAIRNSDAEFLALLDSDDVWLPCRLEESLKLMQTGLNTGLAFGGISRIDSQGKLIDTPSVKLVTGRIAPQIYTREVHLPCPTVTFKRECVEQAGFFNENMRATEDRDLWFRIASISDVASTSKVIAHYRISPNQMSSDPRRMLVAQQQFLTRYRGQPGCGLFTWMKAASIVYRECSEGYLRQRKYRFAFSHAVRAWILNPFDVDNLWAVFGTTAYLPTLKRWIKTRDTE